MSHYRFVMPDGSMSYTLCGAHVYATTIFVETYALPTCLNCLGYLKGVYRGQYDLVYIPPDVIQTAASAYGGSDL